jgi:urea transport system permease protein
LAARTGDTRGVVFVGILLVVAVLTPVLNLAVPASSPFHVSTFVMTLVGKYLCYAMLALAVDLVWGYCGILSLGHGAFFALGGYAMGMYLMRQIGSRGVYGNPILRTSWCSSIGTSCPGSGRDSITSRTRLS